MELQTLLFWAFSILGIAGGVGLILNRNPVYSALSLILNFFSIAGLYLSLESEFLAIIQILVYAGAIMVLFLFVIMLLNLSNEPKQPPFSPSMVTAYVMGLAFLVMLLITFTSYEVPANMQTDVPFYVFSKTETIGAAMMTSYLFPFEMISVILIAALIGAIVVAKKYNYEHKNK